MCWEWPSYKGTFKWGFWAVESFYIIFNKLKFALMGTQRTQTLPSMFYQHQLLFIYSDHGKIDKNSSLTAEGWRDNLLLQLLLLILTLVLLIFIGHSFLLCLFRFLTHAHTATRTHAAIHTRIHSNTHRYTHTRSHSNTHTQQRTRTHTQQHTQIQNLKYSNTGFNEKCNWL